MSEIRAKEATVQVTVAGQRRGGSFLTISDVSIKPDVEIMKKRFTGEKRQVGDLDVKGYDFSFKIQKRDHVWWQTWKEFEAAELAGLEFPVMSVAITATYRGGGGLVKTITLHGGLVFKIDDDNIGSDAGSYQEVSCSGTCSFASGV